jgi:hypothetical protein
VKINLRNTIVLTSYLRGLALCAGLLLFLVKGSLGQENVLEKKITINRQYTTLYNALNQVSEKADCLFIYDSQVVEDDKHVKLVADHLPLKQLLDNLLANPGLGYKVIGKHILIYPLEKVQKVQLTSPGIVRTDTVRTYYYLKGRVFDNENKNPVPYVSIGIEQHNIGTITNTDGCFILKIPADCANASLIISHIGFKSQTIPIQLIDNEQVDIFLERRIISIQEVIIRYIDPVTIVTKAVEQREVNNSKSPVYLTTFYREGVKKNEKVISYSEAVFKVYKSSFDLNEQYDQVKLLKSRKVQNTSAKDTVLIKFKAGILAGLQLDIVKSLPGFLDIEQFPLYTFTYSDLVSYNDREAYAITFKQKRGVEDPLFTGTLFIDNESFAILGADFEVNPDYLDKAINDLVQKKSRKLIVKFEKINYSISYTNYNGRYYLNHARSDLYMKTRFRNRLAFTHFNTFMEIATCHIDTLNVNRFGKQEVIKPDIVFSDAPYQYDEAFWGDYNFIAPEAKLNEALSRILGKIEKIEQDQ